MEGNGEVSQPNQEIIKQPEKIVKVDQDYNNSFGIEKAIIRNTEISPDTVRVYRGIRNFTPESVFNQASNIMRDYRGEVNKDMAQVVENLAIDPNSQNYQKVVNKAKEVSLNNSIIEKPVEFHNSFKENLILQHRNTIRNGIGTSPFVSSSVDPREAYFSAGLNGAIFIIDIPKDRITLDPNTNADENEVLINGYIKENEISAILPIEDDTLPIVDPFPTDESKSQALIDLAQKLVPINPKLS